MSQSSDKILRRYTDIPALMYMLSSRKITLLNPTNWDDRNDSHYLQLYKEKKDLGDVLALCFTEAGETYHHWRVYSSGNSGVCIRFNKKRLLDHIREQRFVHVGLVKYQLISHVRIANLSVDELPFLKRFGFLDEQEFRLICDSSTPQQSKDFPIPLDCIDKILVNPWLNKRLFKSLKVIIHSLPHCENIAIGQSSLVDNSEWKRLGGNAQ
jgi:hypothetical protein